MKDFSLPPHFLSFSLFQDFLGALQLLHAVLGQEMRLRQDWDLSLILSKAQISPYYPVLRGTFRRNQNNKANIFIFSFALLYLSLVMLSVTDLKVLKEPFICIVTGFRNSKLRSLLLVKMTAVFSRLNLRKICFQACWEQLSAIIRF